jgi:hypothetical protein
MPMIDARSTAARLRRIACADDHLNAAAVIIGEERAVEALLADRGGRARGDHALEALRAQKE